ncbi:MAG: lysylphosphatidylglycerol synthase transmembrane domain-containing protein [Coriobacteriia bacterium]|nr:lysylphosphatidylglycerol synthase transmembrane domain-containing protein [Coriobacteriia bacterium]
MKLSARKILIGVVIIVVIAVFVLRGDQLVELAETVKQGSLVPLLVAVCTQLGKYFAQSFAYKYAFCAVEESVSAKDMLPVVFGTFFMNTIAPSLNLAGTTLVVDDARRRGIEPGKATSAALLMQLSVDSAFMCIMVLSFVALTFTVGLEPVWFALGLIVLFIVGCMAGLLVLGYKKPETLVKVLTPISRLINRVLVKFKRNPMKPWVESTVKGFSSAAGMMAKNPKTTAKVFGCSLIASCCELSAFCLVGVGFGVTSPQPLVCGYVVATLFAMVSITPQGVGVVEAAVTVAFTMFGSSAAAGIAIGLVYRCIVFWMPFLIGAVLINFTGTFQGKKAPKQELEGHDAAALEAAAEGVAQAAPAQAKEPDHA